MRTNRKNFVIGERQNLFLAFAMFIFFLLPLTSVHAALNLELTQGINSAMPIAVVPFAGESALAENQAIGAIIAEDLKNSGVFRLINTEGVNPNDYSHWRKSGADNVVVGKVQTQGGSLQVNFQLLDPVGNNHVLLTRQFSVSENSGRRLAHHIADLIYEKLTGEKGVFSTRIAYITVQNKGTRNSVFNLEVADADGYNPHVLLTSPQPIMSPKWSPEGRRLAYVSFENKRAEIYVVDVSTGQRHLVTSFSGINGAPDWSPDGSRLAVVLSKGGSPNIYVVNLASKSLQQVTEGSAIDTEPRWSPDGRSLIFTSDRGGAPQIYQVNLSNKQVQRLTFDGNYNTSASYTPDGKNIVLLHRNNGAFNIAIQNLRTGGLKTLTYSGFDESPSVAPNGKMILYATRLGGRGALSLVSTDGRVKIRLPVRQGEVQGPAWSPFIS